jgi:hypothetical protein
MKALIELICRAHPIADGRGPLITPVDGMWGYCEGHAAASHDWTRIEPTRRELLGDVSQMQDRRAS